MSRQELHSILRGRGERFEVYFNAKSNYVALIDHLDGKTLLKADSVAEQGEFRGSIHDLCDLLNTLNNKVWELERL